MGVLNVKLQPGPRNNLTLSFSGPESNNASRSMEKNIIKPHYSKQQLK